MYRTFFSALFTIAILLTTATACAQAPVCPPPDKLNLKVGQYSLDLQDKRPICVVLGGSFTLNIKTTSGVSVGLDDVKVKQKEGASVKISGRNNVDKKYVVVKVEKVGDEPVDPLDDFWIEVNGVGTLDPIVRVVDSDIMKMLNYEALAEVLKTLGLTWDDATTLLKEQSSSEK